MNQFDNIYMFIIKVSKYVSYCFHKINIFINIKNTIEKWFNNCTVNILKVN